MQIFANNISRHRIREFVKYEICTEFVSTLRHPSQLLYVLKKSFQHSAHANFQFISFSHPANHVAISQNFHFPKLLKLPAFCREGTCTHGSLRSSWPNHRFRFLATDAAAARELVIVLSRNYCCRGRRESLKRDSI